MELDMAGIMAALADPLQRAHIPMFAISTWQVQPSQPFVFPPSLSVQNGEFVETD